MQNRNRPNNIKNKLATKGEGCCCVCAQLCPTLCDPMECSPPGSSVHKIFQTRILEWVAISSSSGLSRPRDQARISVSLALAGEFCTTCATWKRGGE